jgi:hypothetical protein
VRRVVLSFCETKSEKHGHLESQILLSDSKSKSNACSRTTEECKLIPPDARIGLGLFRKGYPTVRAAHEVSPRGILTFMLLHSLEFLGIFAPNQLGLVHKDDGDEDAVTLLNTVPQLEKILNYFSGSTYRIESLVFPERSVKGVSSGMLSS